MVQVDPDGVCIWRVPHRLHSNLLRLQSYWLICYFVAIQIVVVKNIRQLQIYAT